MTPDADQATTKVSQSTEELSASPRLFQNALLDRLSRVHWATPLFIYVPIVTLLCVVALRNCSLPAALFTALLGYAIWTLLEYFGHRFVFHFDFPGPFGAHVHFLIHGVHHAHPNDPLRLVMPALLSAPIMILAYGVGLVLFGSHLVYPALAGFVVGYLSYDMVHYYVHHAHPRTRVGLALRRHHMAHHFRDEERCFGVSAPWWDHVFGTRPVQSGPRTAS